MDFSKLNLDDHQELARTIVLASSDKKLKNRRDFEIFRNKIIKQHKGEIFHNLYFIKAYYDLVEEGKILPNSNFLNLIQKRGVRTQSGVAPVTVLTKPFPCPGRCVYCPTDVRMPKSYLPSQPAAQRAYRQDFDPYKQIVVRLNALKMTGHEISKVELRVIGGTWSYYPKFYQTWFLKRCLLAMNEYYGEKNIEKTFAKVMKINETAKVRCIGINIETRPDYVDKKEVKRLRDLGVTKVEMGVQTIYDVVHKLNCRGHGIKEVKNATKLLKDSGFKIGYHMMPNLPGSTPEMDKKMMSELFLNSDYQPDYLKIYPCVVVPKSRLSSWFKQGKYKTYSDEILEDILFEGLKAVPEWCKVDRVARDIPSGDIESGSKISNIRQLLENKHGKSGGICFRDIRAREIGVELVDFDRLSLVEREYEASGGKEFFISYEDLKKDKLIGLLRLRFPNKAFLGEIRGAALI
ncbi:MAG: tRNA uridine(34) 5-carboxymethylaminomethyl modification radical SAM/GNAT enzyme Elp3, partial [Candidatus Gracilibacteria bacterium]|nr:tRNA uridine(34) 5-carboxymethylaminomethyl modification radical SAM/GNAT enzyme Elp3 [Candidatus Gracilibacteria bacterium]